MIVAFSTAALFPVSTIPALELISRAGFKEAELMPQCREDISSGSVNQIKTLDIRVSSIHFPLVYFPVFYNPQVDMVQEAQELSKALVKAGRTLNIKIIVVHALSKMTPLQREIFQLPVTENIRYLCDQAGEAGITIALENNPKTLAATPEELINQVEVIDRSNIAPMVDTTEAMEADIDPIPLFPK
jgi:sugar phosphate isomerase/epimerase